MNTQAWLHNWMDKITAIGLKGLVSGWLIFLFGPWREGFAYLLVLMGLDLFTGLWAAKIEGRIKSKTLREKTFFKFLGFAAIIAAAWAIERIIVSSGITIASHYTIGAAIVYLALGELISVAENLKRATGRNFTFWDRDTATTPTDKEQK